MVHHGKDVKKFSAQVPDGDCSNIYFDPSVKKATLCLWTENCTKNSWNVLPGNLFLFAQFNNWVQFLFVVKFCQYIINMGRLVPFRQWKNSIPMVYHLWLKRIAEWLQLQTGISCFKDLSSVWTEIIVTHHCQAFLYFPVVIKCDISWRLVLDRPISSSSQQRDPRCEIQHDRLVQNGNIRLIDFPRFQELFVTWCVSTLFIGCSFCGR